jgi:hypothetical protein
MHLRICEVPARLRRRERNFQMHEALSPEATPADSSHDELTFTPIIVRLFLLVVATLWLKNSPDMYNQHL